MKVVLFASGVLAAVGEALSLSQSVHRNTADLTMGGYDPLTLAQTSQGVPDANQLRERAAKAMDKDDKKKMGDEKFNLFRRIRKKLEGKNAESKKLAQDIENALSNKKEDSKEEDKKEDKPAEKKPPPKPAPKERDKKQDQADNKEKVKSAVTQVKKQIKTNKVAKEKE